MRSLLPSLFALCFVWIACKSDKKVDQDTIADERKEREIKKVTEAEIYAAAEEWGEAIARESQQALGSQLKQAMASGGPVHAIEFCNVAAYPILDSVENKYGITIKRTSLKVRNPKDKPDSLERKILEAYHYNFKNETALEPNVQSRGEEVLLFSKPIMLDNGICLSCHGTPGKEINDPTLQTIRDLYPGDDATGYSLNDLRGMWSISIPKKTLIREKL